MGSASASVDSLMSQQVYSAEFTGISIEDPNLFEYNGRWYLFAASITNPDISLTPERLDNKNLQLFEYSNEINDLCLKGRIVYTDIDGNISKYFNRLDNHIVVGVKQMIKKTSGTGANAVEMFEEFGRAEGADKFIHSFIVQNMGIVDRKEQAITYQLDLISTNWYKVCSKIVFSNYSAKSDNDENKPKNIYKIMQALFVADNLITEPDGFKNISEKSKIRLDYSTNGNEDITTALPYLFNRLYYNKKQFEQSLKFIAYEPLKDWYRLIDYEDEKTWPKIAKPLTLLSLFETQYEGMLFSVSNQLASVVAKPQTKTYEDVFDHGIWNYDKTDNSFDFQTFSFSSEDLITFQNNKTKTFNSSSQWMPEDKYPEQLNIDWFKNEKKTYAVQTSLWNNDYSIYQNVLDNMMKRDALIVNTEGDITHQPGCLAGVVLDRTIEKNPDMTAAQKEELNRKHRQIEGLFQIVKVRHMYKPSTPAPSYTENLVLGRNFILKPAAASPVASIIG